MNELCLVCIEFLEGSPVHEAVENGIFSGGLVRSCSNLRVKVSYLRNGVRVHRLMIF